MTITSQGYKGSVDEKGWARLHASLAGWVTSGFDTTAVGGARQVSVAAGVAESYGVEVSSDAAVPSAVFPAPANGQWYLVALERNWDPAVRASSVVFLAGPTTASNTVPVRPPAAAPVTYGNIPGTKSHQPLYWAFVSSANTTVTLFDVRLTPNLTGGVQAPSLEALMVANYCGLLRDGGVVAVAAYNLLSGGLHYRSLWQRVGGAGAGYLAPVGTIEVNDQGTTGRGVTDLQNAATAGYPLPIGFLATTEVLDINSQTRWRWSPAGVRWRVVANERTILVAQHNSGGSLTRGGFQDINWDTVIRDPVHMLQSNATDILLPYDGLYELEAKFAAGVDMPLNGRTLLRWAVPSGVEGAWGGVSGQAQNIPWLYRDTFAGSANVLIRVSVFVDGSGSAGIPTVGSQLPRLTLKYLGQAD